MTEKGPLLGDFIVLSSDVLTFLFASFIDDACALCACAQLNSHWKELVEIDDQVRWAARLKVANETRPAEKVRFS